MTAALDLQQPAAFNPDQPRDPDGKWGHGLGHVVEKLFKFSNGDLDTHVDGDGVHLGYGDSTSGALTVDHRGRNAAWELADRLDGHTEGKFPRTNSIASYPPGDPNAAPTGFAQVTQLSPTEYRLELLNNDTTFDLSKVEAKQLSEALYRAGGSHRVDTGTGPLDVYVPDDRHVGMRTLGSDGKPAELNFDETSWDRFHAALNVAYEGFDEGSQFGHSPDEDLSELRVSTNVGELLIRRTGVPAGPDHAGEGTLEITPVGRNDWHIAFPTDLDGAWNAFIDAEQVAFESPQNRVTTQLRASADRRREGQMRLRGRDGALLDTASAVHHTDSQSSDDVDDRLAAFRARMRRPVARQGHAWYRIRNTAAGEAEIFLFDEIGFWGTSAEEFVAELKGIAASRITVRINSPGGDVADGLAIYNALRAHPAHITTRVDGLAASAASFIFQAGDRRVTARNGIVMIHDALGLWCGNAAEMRQYADLLDKLSDNVADIYAQHGGGDVAAWRALMLAETWFTGAEAVAAGLADEMTDPDPDPQDAPPEMRNSWDLTVFRYAGRDQAPAPTVRAAVEPVEPTVPPAGDPAPDPTPATVDPPQPPRGDDTAEPPPTPGGETAPTDDWDDVVAQLLDTAPSTVDDALAALREAHSE